MKYPATDDDDNANRDGIMNQLLPPTLPYTDAARNRREWPASPLMRASHLRQGRF